MYSPSWLDDIVPEVVVYDYAIITDQMIFASMNLGADVLLDDECRHALFLSVVWFCCQGMKQGNRFATEELNHQLFLDYVWQ